MGILCAHMGAMGLYTHAQLRRQLRTKHVSSCTYYGQKELLALRRCRQDSDLSYLQRSLARVAADYFSGSTVLDLCTKQDPFESLHCNHHTRKTAEGFVSYECSHELIYVWTPSQLTGYSIGLPFYTIVSYNTIQACDCIHCEWSHTCTDV